MSGCAECRRLDDAFRFMLNAHVEVCRRDLSKVQSANEELTASSKRVRHARQELLEHEAVHCKSGTI